MQHSPCTRQAENKTNRTKATGRAAFVPHYIMPTVLSDALAVCVRAGARKLSRRQRLNEKERQTPGPVMSRSRSRQSHPCRRSVDLYLRREYRSRAGRRVSVTYLVVVLPADGVRRLGAQPDDAGQIDGAAHADEDLAAAQHGRARLCPAHRSVASGRREQQTAGALIIRAGIRTACQNSPTPAGGTEQGEKQKISVSDTDDETPIRLTLIERRHATAPRLRPRNARIFTVKMPD